MGADEEGTLAHLKASRKTFGDPPIVAHRGRILKTTGGGMLVECARAADAARCGVEIQRERSGLRLIWRSSDSSNSLLLGD